ncbi:MAG: cell division protein ZapA [bacterium]|nr:cell division protein ZapA [bacterium]
MESDKNVLKVRIYGAEYLIRGQADVNYMQSVAEYVNDKMLEIDQTIRTDSSLKVAILATLNITDELFRERSESEAIRNELENKIRELNLLIDRQLSASDV